MIPLWLAASFTSGGTQTSVSSHCFSESVNMSYHLPLCFSYPFALRICAEALPQLLLRCLDCEMTCGFVLRELKMNSLS